MEQTWEGRETTPISFPLTFTYTHPPYTHEVNIIKIKKFVDTELGACYCCALLAEAGGLLEPRDQPGLHSFKRKQNKMDKQTNKTLFQIKVFLSDEQQECGTCVWATGIFE